ncbi:MAG: hypothetical protein QXT77_09730 [Candidatus Methanomethylicaceae archaeon]
MKLYKALILNPHSTQLLDSLPHGAGIDSDYYIEYNEKKDKLAIISQYHLMNQYGFYTRWVRFEVIVTPSLVYELNVKIKGRLPADLKDYLHDLFYDALTSDIKE